MKREITEEERAALAVLRSTGADVLEAALLAREALAYGGGKAERARKCQEQGREQLRLRERTVSFRRAVEAALEARQGCRRRTVIDFRYICKRLMERNPGLAERRVRSMTASDCARYLGAAFPGSPAQYRKARATLSGVFGTAVKQGWCDAPPVAQVALPRVEEKPIAPLTAGEVARLEAAARQPEHREMRLSLHLLLYCGIRPAEVSRLRAEDVSLEERQVVVRPQASKTGGGRTIPLRGSGRLRGAPLVIPRDWQRRWRALRRAAGFTRWVADACRHSFASYHAAQFRNLQELQWEMGHRDSTLLRTRYVSPVEEGCGGVLGKRELVTPAARVVTAPRVPGGQR